MLAFEKTKVAKERLNGAKQSIKYWYVDIDNIVISKLIEIKNYSKHLIGYLNDVIRPSVMILPKMSVYIKNFKVKNNKLMSFRIDDRPLEKYKTIWTKIEDVKDI